MLQHYDFILFATNPNTQAQGNNGNSDVFIFEAVSLGTTGFLEGGKHNQLVDISIKWLGTNLNFIKPALSADTEGQFSEVICYNKIFSFGCLRAESYSCSKCLIWLIKHERTLCLT